MNLMERYRLKENYMNEHDAKWWMGHIDVVTLYDCLDLVGNMVIDIGCHCGGLTSLMSNIIKNVVGIDMNDKAIESAKKRFEGTKNLDFICCIANNMPFKDGEFTGAFCLQMLEHLFKEDIEPTLREISRVVRKDGYIVVKVPRSGDLNDRIHKIRAYDKAHESFLYTEDEVIKFFMGMFEIISISHEKCPNPGRPEERHNSWLIILKNNGGKNGG